MITTEHQIDLSTIPHRSGQSVDLEPKRQRAWSRLPPEERESVIDAYGRSVSAWEIPFLEAGGAYERVLYALVVTGATLTPAQISYLLIARWYHNTDPATVRSKLAAMVRNGHARWTRDGAYYATDRGAEHLRGIEQAWKRRRST